MEPILPPSPPPEEPSPAAPPAPPTYSCPVCSRPMGLGQFEAGPQLCPCPQSRRFEAMMFRSPGAVVPAVRGLGPEGGQPCARHEGNAASANCERCGVFMCTLCEVAVDGQKLCPDCFDRLSTGGELGAAFGSRRDWNALAHLSVLVGLLFSCFGLGAVLGPLAIWLALRSLGEKRKQGEQGGFASDYAAIAFGALLVLGSIAALVALTYGVLSDG